MPGDKESMRPREGAAAGKKAEGALLNADCMEVMAGMEALSVDFTLTDIPYAAVNRKGNGLRSLDKGRADELRFDLDAFLSQVHRLTRNSLAIFCGKEQFSRIHAFFAAQKGTVRPIVWEKSNPSPMNGRHIYLSGVEMGVWFKRSGAKTFNAFCKNTVFRHPNGSGKRHPTEKNHALLRELIADNTNAGDLVFDPCMGGGSHLLVARSMGRRFLGIEIDPAYFAMAREMFPDLP